VRCCGLVVALAFAVGKAEVRDRSVGNCSGDIAIGGIEFRGSYESMAPCDTENNYCSSGNGAASLVV
jgi:hypothetical protein